MEANIDTAQDVVDTLVNEDGSLTSTVWTSFFHADVAGFDGSMPFARQLHVVDGSVTQLMHLMGANAAAEQAEAIATTIGYEGLGHTGATALFAVAPDLTVTVTDVFASGLGPAAVADMAATVDGSECSVRTGVVWETGDDGRVTREHVYYDPNTLIACGWVR